MFTRGCHWSLSWAGWIQSTHLCPTSLRYIWILSSHLSLVSLVVSFHQVILLKRYMQFAFPPCVRHALPLSFSLILSLSLSDNAWRGVKIVKVRVMKCYLTFQFGRIIKPELWQLLLYFEVSSIVGKVTEIGDTRMFWRPVLITPAGYRASITKNV
jgi:hypothetical protein